MKRLANAVLMPPWAVDPQIAPHYWATLRRLVGEFSESVSTAELALENWRSLVDLPAQDATTPGDDPFRDFWPWYSELSD